MGKSLSKEQRDAWTDRIQLQQESGLSIQRWCKENAVTPHLFHYWKQRLLPNEIDRASFAELTEQTGYTIDIAWQDVRIHIDSPTVRKAFQVLKELKC